MRSDTCKSCCQPQKCHPELKSTKLYCTVFCGLPENFSTTEIGEKDTLHINSSQLVGDLTNQEPTSIHNNTSSVSPKSMNSYHEASLYIH